MGGIPLVTEVRGGEVRCSGSSDAPHPDVLVEVPADEVVACPKCGRRFQRASWWNVLSGAIWPDTLRR